MKKEEINIIVYLSITIAAIIGSIYLAILGKELNTTNSLRAISTGITSATFFWAFYFSIGWKTKFLRSLFHRPNLNGTWGGKLYSDWKDDKGNTVSPIEFYIVIRQSFLRIHFTTFTESYIGISYAETLSLNNGRGIKHLAYLYRKDTSQNNNEVLQEGATELKIINSGNEKFLKGKYWSSSKTNGSIRVKHLTSEKVDSFQDAQKLT